MVLVVVGQAVVHVHLTVKVPVQRKVNFTSAGLVHLVVDPIRARVRGDLRGLAHCIVDDDLSHLIAEVEKSYAYRNEQDPDDEKGGEDRASSQNGLPCRKSLLFERGI